MKKIFWLAFTAGIIISCNDKIEKGQFSIQGDIKNVDNQKVYLEQLFFSQKSPEVLDTAEIKNGKFELNGIAGEEGLFRIRIEKSDAGFIFINDEPTIKFEADMKDVSLTGPEFNTPANSKLKNLLIDVDKRRQALKPTDTLALSDSARADLLAKRNTVIEEFKSYIVKFIDTTSDPVVAMFALGFTREIDPSALGNTIPDLAKRFPKHQGVAEIVKEYNNYVAKSKEPKPVETGRPGIGSMAPDFTMADTEGKPFSLSALKGKYVLVDFWASWCGPCRGENPNLVAAYNKFKDKNFTILGVSLDEDKDKWLAAIKKDQLTWKQISDLKQWQSAAVPLYAFDGIPYNVLLDPNGKIIATELRGGDLERKLEEVLK